MKNFHVLVEWPNGEQPWLVLIEATSAQEARHAIETSEGVQQNRGKVVSIEDVTVGLLGPPKARMP